MIIKSINYNTNLIVLSIHVSENKINTNQVPGFREYVLTKIPELKYHTCHNSKNHNFCHELQDTEMAHVFEHILIERILKLDNSVEDVKGWTAWDWKKNPRGSFDIEIEYPNKKIFSEALENTIALFRDFGIDPKLSSRIKT